MRTQTIFIALLSAVTSALPCGQGPAESCSNGIHGEEPSLPLPGHILNQFGEGTWVENIAVRPNGDLIVSTSTPNASVYEVDQPWLESPTVSLVHTFDDHVDRLIGIGASSPDKFVVVGSRFDSTTESGMPINGTWAVLEIDFTGDDCPPSARLIAAMPDAFLLQRVAALPWNPTLLISSSFLKSPGVVWRVGTRTEEYSLAVKDLPEMQTSLIGAPVGINGIKICGNNPWWVNSDRFTLYRLEIDQTGAAALGAKPEAIAYYQDAVLDDFCFGSHNEPIVWATRNADNGLLAFDFDGRGAVVLGNGTDHVFPTPTACALSSGGPGNLMYVTGRDKTLPLANGSFVIGGGVRAFDVGGFWLGDE